MFSIQLRWFRSHFPSKSSILLSFRLGSCFTEAVLHSPPYHYSSVLLRDPILSLNRKALINHSDQASWSSELPHLTSTKALPPLQSPYSIQSSRFRQKKPTQEREEEKSTTRTERKYQRPRTAPATPKAPKARQAAAAAGISRTALEESTTLVVLTMLGITACYRALVCSSTIPICHCTQ